MSETTEGRRDFRAHKNLIRLVIERQAGTVAKSALEGVMNSIDAKCSRIDVEIDTNKLSIKDDGKGFKTKEEIYSWFEEFGNPHELDDDGYSVDAKYGTFRSGRGQLFAFGKNTWKTNSFCMEVDIRKDGLNYKLTELKNKVKGCEILVDFYDPLDPGQQHRTAEEIKKFCKYVDTDVYVNGERINTPPAEAKWDHEDENCYIKFAEGANGRGIDVYQLGVLVENISPSTYGVSGTVVTKQQVKLNFARNQVIRSCPRWKKVLKELGARAANVIINKQRLSETERAAVINSLKASERTYKWIELKLFRDVSGRFWSMRDFELQASGASKRQIFDPTPDKKLIFSIDGDHSVRADTIMQQRKAVVLDKSTMLLFGVNGGAQLWALLNKFYNERYHRDCSVPLKFEPIENLLKITKTQYDIVPVSKYTPTEKQVLETLNNLRYMMHHGMGMNAFRRYDRNYVMGISSSANGWTDGNSYIAIARSFLKGVDVNTPQGWVKLVQLVIHELCHDSTSANDTHVHSMEFYREFHDLCMAKLTVVSKDLYTNYMCRLKSNGKRLNAKMKKALAQEEYVKSLADKNEKLGEDIAKHNTDGKLSKAPKKKATKK